jgi:xanthine dehydrogenase YagR molybdenum-binding subunit
MNAVGQPLNRVDGLAKVTGSARYSAENNLPQLAHAVPVSSTVARGRIRAIDTSTARAMPGVMLVMTHENAMRLPKGGEAAFNPPAGRKLTLLQDDKVHFQNQPVAVVVADTLEHATDAAQRVRVSYAAETPATNLTRGRGASHPPDKVQGKGADSTRGEGAPAVLPEGAVRIEADYTTPVEHHNPIEPHATVASWQGDQLTLFDSTQYVSGVRRTIARTLGVEEANIHVVCPYVGGGFGCKGSTWSHVALAAMAARQVGRPVKLVLDRPQMYGPVGHRPNTEQHIAVVARRDGTLIDMQHDVFSQTSMLEDWVESSAIVTRMLYNVPNLRTSHRLVSLDLPTPTFMRAPGEATGSFALESVLDELAWKLEMDPVELRMKNYAQTEPQEGKPWSSKHLADCYRIGSERFGWSKRARTPRATLEGNEWIGWGMATATYPANRSKAAAIARILPDGTAYVASGSQDLGTGTYTVMTQVAADGLGFPVERVTFALGDSTLPPAPVSGGSQSAASVSAAVRTATQGVREKLVTMAVGDAASPLSGVAPDAVTVEDGWLVLRSDGSRREPAAAVIARNGGQPLEVVAEVQPGDEKQRFSFHSFGAVFVEVRVDRDLGTIRVSRVVGVYDVGRLLNAKTGHSQLMGGLVWGIGAALMEQSEIDGRDGRVVNGNLADYHVPVNADVGMIDVSVLNEPDPFINPDGVRGIGEIGITGMAGAVANAVFHATGVRVRDLPITLDKVMI